MEPIAISLHNRSDADRHEQPVAIGVPFTRGQFNELPAFVVTLPDGERLPTQAHHLLSWDDDSVKFALVQFPATVPARATGRVHLRVGRPPDPPEPCRLEVFSDRLEIDTGPARFTVRKRVTAGMHRELAAFQAPVIPAPDPVYFCQTGAFGPLRAAGEGAFAEFDRSIRAGFDAWQREMAADPRNFGMMNYGDFFSVAGYGAEVGMYMDEEYDPADGLYLLFARSGDPDYFEAAGRLVRHFIDVDVHQLTGHQSFHGYPPRVERHEENIMEHGMDWGHIFNDSAIDYCLLTGDRYVGAIERILNYLGRFAVDSWKDYAEGGWWWRTMMHDGCKPFMLGLVFEGFCQYHQVSRKPRVSEVLTTIATG